MRYDLTQFSFFPFFRCGSVGRSVGGKRAGNVSARRRRRRRRRKKVGLHFVARSRIRTRKLGGVQHALKHIIACLSLSLVSFVCSLFAQKRSREKQRECERDEAKMGTMWSTNSWEGHLLSQSLVTMRDDDGKAYRPLICYRHHHHHRQLQQ